MEVGRHDIPHTEMLIEKFPANGLQKSLLFILIRNAKSGRKNRAGIIMAVDIFLIEHIKQISCFIVPECICQLFFHSCRFFKVSCRRSLICSDAHRKRSKRIDGADGKYRKICPRTVDITDIPPIRLRSIHQSITVIFEYQLQTFNCNGIKQRDNLFIVAV